MAQITLNSNGVASSGSLTLQSNGTTTAVTIDTSQNLGLGVTPSAWGSGITALQFAKEASLSSHTTGGNLFINSNTFYNGTNWVYQTSTAASQYRQFSGAHNWYTAPSGTAGNAITFSQAMTLDASGNLFLGTTGITGGLSGQVFNLFGSGTVRSIVQTTGQFSVYNLGSGGTSVSPATAGFLLTDSSANTLNLYASTNTPLLFGTNNTERARIDSGGNLLVGTTTAGAKLRVVQNVGGAGTPATAIREISGDPYGLNISYGATPNGPDNYFILASDNSAARFYVKSNGGIANYSANNSNLSDERTKTDIQDAGGYLAKICAIPVRTFKYKDQTDDLLNLGVIAQEVEIVAPELVDSYGFSETPEDGVPLKAIYQTDLQYALMKCIQELNAKVEAQAAEIAALKG